MTIGLSIPCWATVVRTIESVVSQPLRTQTVRAVAFSSGGVSP